MKRRLGTAQHRPVVFRREDEDKSHLEIPSYLTNEPLEGRLRGGKW
jgi:hypothetical protein